MKKNDLIRVVAGDTGVSKSTVEAIVNSAIQAITRELGDGNTVSIHDFGTLSVEHKAAHPYYNIHTKTKELAPEKNVIRFTPASSLKSVVN